MDNALNEELWQIMAENDRSLAVLRLEKARGLVNPGQPPSPMLVEVIFEAHRTDNLPTDVIAAVLGITGQQVEDVLGSHELFACRVDLRTSSGWRDAERLVAPVKLADPSRSVSARLHAEAVLVQVFAKEPADVLGARVLVWVDECGADADALAVVEASRPRLE